MDRSKIYPPREINDYSVSVYSNKPAMLGYEAPGMVSVKVKDLFPNMPDAIYSHSGDDLSKTTKSTREALEAMDMSMIKPGDTVNILTCEHGFLMFGGLPYVEMIKTIQDVVKERTGCYDICVKIVMYRTPREGEEVIDFYHLKEVFGNVEGVSSYEKGVGIETRIGTLWGLEKVFNADHIIFAYYDDPREIYVNNYYRKAFKAFTMDLMRLETRTLFHFGFGSPTGHATAGMIVPTSVYDSDFIQKKWCFCCFMRTTPNGLMKIEASESLYDMDVKCSETALKYYPYMNHLLTAMKDYTIILDGSRWVSYMHCAGLIAGINWNAYVDHYDLKNAALSPDEFRAAVMDTSKQNLRSIIINQGWYGLSIGFPRRYNTFLVGEELRALFDQDTFNHGFNQLPLIHHTKNLPEAMEEAKKLTGSDRFVVYDGSYGYINCTESAAEELFAKAPMIKEKVDNKLYPMYMKQRGYEIPDFMK